MAKAAPLIDANGILHVSARDRATGKEQRITITQSSGLPREDVERMVAEAKAHEEEDRRRREEVEERNRADGTVYQAEKLLRENEARLEVGTREALRSAVARVQQAREGPIEGLREALRDLEAATHRAAEELYRAAGPPPPSGQPPGGGKGGDGGEGDVIDAEYRPT